MLRHERLQAQPQLSHSRAATPQPRKAEASHLHPAKPQGATATSRAEQHCSVTTATGWSTPMYLTKVPLHED